jgi:hypothetical protein
MSRTLKFNKCSQNINRYGGLRHLTGASKKLPTLRSMANFAGDEGKVGRDFNGLSGCWG